MSNVQGQFGDTTLTKVFIGGLAWETPMETLRDYFLHFGEILEAVIISDKLSGRSKGYGFVTFKEPEAAKKACEDPTPMINGRRTNCNLAALGARRHKMTSRTPTPPPQHGTNISNNVGFGMGKTGGGLAVVAPPPASQLQWCFPVGVPPAVSPYHHHVPIYGYSPAYVAAEYSPKVTHNGGTYYPYQMYTGAAAGHPMMAGVAGNALIPMYSHHQHPFYHHQFLHHHRAQAMGLPAHMFHAATASPFTPAGPTALISKPTPLPTPVAVGGVDGLKSTS